MLNNPYIQNLNCDNSQKLQFIPVKSNKAVRSANREKSYSSETMAHNFILNGVFQKDYHCFSPSRSRSGSRCHCSLHRHSQRHLVDVKRGHIVFLFSVLKIRLYKVNCSF